MTRSIAGICLVAMLSSAGCDQEASLAGASQDGGERDADGAAGRGGTEPNAEGGRGSAGSGGGSGDGEVLDSGTQAMPDAGADDGAEPDPDAGTGVHPEAGTFQCPDGTICLEACAEGHIPVPTQSECLQMGPACYPLFDGTYCLAPQLDPCPPGFQSVPPGEPCDAGQGCYQYSDDVYCTPVD